MKSMRSISTEEVFSIKKIISHEILLFIASRKESSSFLPSEYKLSIIIV